MTRAATCLALALAAGLPSCARPAPEVPAPPPRTLIALAADPETGEVGRLIVSGTNGSIDLAERGASTTVAEGSAPSNPVVLSDADLARIFGAALALQPPPARHFMLYFELGGDELTAESKERLAEVLETVRTRVAPEVRVIGHTDTTGTAASNRELGLKRAALIRDLLLTTGLDAALVEVASHGESELLVATTDNVDEPRNRRVEVSVR